MDKYFHRTLPAVTAGALPLVLVVALLLGAGWYFYAKKQAVKYDDLKEELHTEVTVLGDKLATLDQYTRTIGQDLSTTKNESTALAEKLRAEQEKAASLETSVSKISGTVGTLEKLSKTDPELLQKYSKVYFLSENYVPERLIDIPADYLYSEKRLEQFEQRIWAHLERMLDAARNDGVKLYVKSAYRSFGEQKDLKNSYSITYGAGTANTFSAEQGYSEHQLGTTIDLITTGLGGQLSGFDTTPAYNWLLLNAHKYGFTLSYPKGNAYYIFEPWHWRFVGVELAAHLKSNNTYFYSLDQREIDKYLVNILD